MAALPWTLYGLSKAGAQASIAAVDSEREAGVAQIACLLVRCTLRGLTIVHPVRVTMPHSEAPYLLFIRGSTKLSHPHAWLLAGQDPSQQRMMGTFLKSGHDGWNVVRRRSWASRRRSPR